MEILFPLTFLISAFGQLSGDFSLQSTISPDSIFSGGCGIRRMMDLAVTLFPQPDSPTIPIVSPAPMEN